MSEGIVTFHLPEIPTTEPDRAMVVGSAMETVKELLGNHSTEPFLIVPHGYDVEDLTELTVPAGTVTPEMARDLQEPGYIEDCPDTVCIRCRFVDPMIENYPRDVFTVPKKALCFAPNAETRVEDRAWNVVTGRPTKPEVIHPFCVDHNDGNCPDFEPREPNNATP